MPPKRKILSKVYRFEIVKKLSRPRSYIKLKEYHMDMFNVVGDAFSRILGGK
jgi:hypothetical protein